MQPAAAAHLALAHNLAVARLPDDRPQHALHFGDGRRVLVLHARRRRHEIGEADVGEKAPGQQAFLRHPILLEDKFHFVLQIREEVKMDLATGNISPSS